MPRKRYLTEETFQAFLDNHWLHLSRQVWQIKGGLVVLIPLVLAILAMVITLALRK